MNTDLNAFVPDVIFEKIPIKNLVSCQDYRRALSESQILKIAREFDLYQINPVKVILISIKNIFYPFALSNAHDGITRKVVDCLAETVYHLFQCSKYLIAKSSGS